jgi:hypothetical protein
MVECEGLTVKFLIGRMLSNLEMTLDWAAQSLKLHQFWYAGAPTCPLQGAIDLSQTDSSAGSAKFAHGRNKQEFSPSAHVPA